MSDRPGTLEEVDVIPLPPSHGSTDPSPREPGRPAPHARRQAVLSLAAGLVLLLAAPVAYFSLRPAPAGQNVSSVGSDQAAALQQTAAAGPSADVAVPSAAATPPVPPEPAASAGPAASAAAPSAPSAASPAAGTPPGPDAAPAAEPEAAAPAAPAPAAPLDPSRLVVPALGVDAAVVQIGVQPSGLLEIPSDVSTVGWYRYGPTPGSGTGSAVLSGHVDAADQGPGTFARLGDLDPGDTVEVTDSAGVVRGFTVIAREEWTKDDVPLDRIFDRGGDGRLVLITCGGAFDEDTLSYTDNVAVTAVLSGG